MKNCLISSENIPCINLILHIVQTNIIAVCNDSLTLHLKLCQVVYDLASKERAAILKCWLVDDDLSPLCLNSLHDALNGRLAEIVRV